MKTTRSKLDVFDMLNFSKFFKELYSKPSISPKKIKELQDEMDRDATQQTLTEILDQDISSEELLACTRVLKKGKAVSEDLIPNEFLKLSGKNMQCAILHFFNQCLSHRVYPWAVGLENICCDASAQRRQDLRSQQL